MAGTVTNDYGDISRHFRAVATDETAVDVRIELDGQQFDFAAEHSEQGSYRLLKALRLVAVRDRASGVERDHAKTGTTALPTELVRAINGATYRYVSEDDPETVVSPQKEREVTDVIRQPDGRWVACLAPGDGVVTTVHGLLRDAAHGKVEFLTLPETAE